MKILPSNYSFKALLIATLFLSALTTGFVQAQDEAQGSSEGAISQAELEQILAPIALYPDTILSHILVASTYPLEVVQAERWALQNPDLQGQEVVDAADEKGWDPSVQALLAFPKVLNRMSQDLEWTQRLGDAFIQDEESVLASVQTLRELAQEAGSLDKMEKMTVTRDRNSIIIEPREREVVYVPYYDTRVVYGPWRWSHYQPTYWGYPYGDSLYYNDHYAHHPRRPFYWGPRISLSFGFFSNTFNWRNHHIVRISSRHYRPHRYYGHHDILGHRYAERWVHNSNRRHGNRNSHYNTSGYNNGRNDRAGRNNNQIQRQQTREGLRQERVREQLRDRRNNGVATRSTRRVITPQNRVQTNRNTSANQRASVNTTRTTTNNPASNSRVALPRRTRTVENNQRVVNRSATRTVTRQAPAKPANQVNRTAPAPAQQRVVRAQRQQSVNRSASTPKPAAVEQKSAPSKAQNSARAPRRQPR